MKRTAILCLLILLPLLGTSQNYFQQQVNYDMNVSLDPEARIYEGDAIISYTNNSPDPLSEIYFHIWANSYSSVNSEFGKQQLRMNQKEFHFHDQDKLGGGYEDISFAIGNTNLEFIYHDDNPDIVLVQLNKTLEPGQTINIETKFKVKVPIFFSRMGNQDGYFQITQWFPKPAVYDTEGWHQMPYLDMGEFFSEFGEYKVTINVPNDYKVAATGSATGISEPNNSTTSYSFNAKNVHDFAWCAHNDFRIEESSVTLPNGEEIDLFVYKTNDHPSWNDAMQYLKNAVNFYSEEVGNYPYPQATVIQSPGGTGGGMEYPMLTTIDTQSDPQAVDHVIAHEVGHNWFYGILASNERVNAWMDEGINSFYDHKYNDLYYENGTYDNMLPKFLQGDSEASILESSLVWQCKRGRNQACSTHCIKLNMSNYGFSAYEYPAWSLKYLESYLGEEVMSHCIHNYYDEWKFKHPKPEDVEEVFERVSGKDLDWFFKELINSDGYVDHALQIVDSTQVAVKNAGQVNIPIRLDYKKDGEWIAHQWVEAFEGVQFVKLKNQSFDELAINGKVPYVDVNPQNNSKKLNGKNLIKPKLKLLGQIDDPKRAELFFLPFAGFNVHDGFMPFISFYNSVFPLKWTRFNGNFGYGTRSKDLVGSANLEHDIMLNSSGFRKITLALNYRHFNYRTPLGDTDELFYYDRLSPSIALHINPYFSLRKEEWLKYSLISLRKRFDNEDNPEEAFDDRGIFHVLEFNRVSKKALNPSVIKVEAMYHNYDSALAENSSFLKLSATAAGKLFYAEKSAFHYRIFAGFFPINSSRNVNSYNNDLARGSLNLAYNPFADVAFSEYWFGRSQQMAATEQQIRTLEGGFKTGLLYNNGSLGKSNHALFAINLKSDIPVPLFRIIPIKPYFDLGFYASPEDEQFEWNLVYDAGIAIEFFDGDLGVYLSLLQSERISQIYDSENFSRRIGFQVNINRLKPWDLIDQLDL